MHSNTTAEFLQKCPISILDWNEDLTAEFSQCFRLVTVKPGKEVRLSRGARGMDTDVKCLETWGFSIPSLHASLRIHSRAIWTHVPSLSLPSHEIFFTWHLTL